MSDKQDFAIRLLRVLRYNHNRIVKALALFPAKKRPLFNVVPFLLHVNDPAFPGYVDDPAILYGLTFYAYSKAKQDLFEIFPENELLIENPKPIWPKQRYIESLSLMGSIGTTAQSEKSDLDYWVCVDGGVVKDQKWDLLQQKLTLIEDWAWQQHQLEVHFFLSDIEKVRSNDFGAADGESAGSAQPTFLKNEYYSTTILISGKIPFWWLTPFDCTDELYDQQYASLQTSIDPNPEHFIDLGNIEKLQANEIFGATIWQLTKAMDSPFKSVLKMAKLEVSIDHAEKRLPLCNLLKQRVHMGVNIDKDLRSTDPYALMFDSIMEYYQQNNPKFLELFKACMYIKSDCALTIRKVASKPDFKRAVMIDYVQEWQWKLDKVKNYDRVHDWEFQQVSLLGQKIHSFLIGCYRRLSAKLQDFEQLVSDEDMTVIGRKIDSFYTVKKGKIPHLKRAFESGLMQKDVAITMELDLSFDTKQRWSAFRGRLHYPDTIKDNPCFLKQSSDPVDLVLWCLFNRIINANTRFCLLQSKLPISPVDIAELMNDALVDYQPIRVSELAREQLLAPYQITHCLMVVNFSSHSSESEIETVRVIYLTSWGEVYSFADMSIFDKIKPQFIIQPHHPICRLFTPSRNKRKILYRLAEELTDFEFDKV
ncbi:MAG: adenylate cyclase class 1 [Alteromonadaceae bacterium]|jgi:adenylate cyclase class 1